MICGRGGDREVVPAGCSSTVEKKSPRIVYGQGYIRGNVRRMLKNKYAGYVSKVNFLTGRAVKKGDVILEYDDWAWRSSVESARNKISELEKNLEAKKIQLELKRLDPLPSDFRHTKRKILSAKEDMKRAENEWQVYERLFKSHGISELDLRQKKQSYLDAKTTYENYISDHNKIAKGMAELYVRQIENEVETLKLQIANRKREFELLLEEGKYYKITAPIDGIAKTHSDTVASYNAAGTEAACVHGGDRRYIYSYFEVMDTRFMVEGDKAKFRSTHTGEVLDLELFEVSSARTVYGEKVYRLVKFRVAGQTGNHLRVESSGIVEYPLVHGPEK